MIVMNDDQRPIAPHLAVDSRSAGNLRRARLDFEEVDLQLEELVAKCDEVIHQQKLQRIQTKKANVAIG
jgi:hypothetical protein